MGEELSLAHHASAFEWDLGGKLEDPSQPLRVTLLTRVTQGGRNAARPFRARQAWLKSGGRASTRSEARSPRAVTREGSVVDVVRKPSSVPHPVAWGAAAYHSSRTSVASRLEQPTRGLGRAVLCSFNGPRSSRTSILQSAPAYVALLPMGSASPSPLLEMRWAFTPPFHPYPAKP